jgi:hypothetical protein
MDQSAEDVTATQLTKAGALAASPLPDGMGMPRPRLRRAAPVVVLDVDAENANKLPGADEQQLVQALPADRPDPTFGDSVSVRRPNRCADDLDIG